MFIEIENISEKILNLMDDKGSLDFYEIKENINEPVEFITQSLQWLILTEFIKEDPSTGRYAINGLQDVSKEEVVMTQTISKN